MVGYQQGNIIKKVVFSIIALLLGIELGDVVVSTITDVNTTAWNFTGYQAVVAVVNLIPLMYYASVVVGAGMAFLYIR